MHTNRIINPHGNKIYIHSIEKQKDVEDNYAKLEVVQTLSCISKNGIDTWVNNDVQ